MNDTPTATPKIAQIAYWAAFATAVAGLLIDGLAPQWWPNIAHQLTDTAAIIVEALVVIAVALGATAPIIARTRQLH